jgi:hypothetical protein
MDDEVLTTSQRTALVEYAGVVNAAAMDDTALLEAVAEKIGMTGEMSIDPDGIAELQRGDVLITLAAVADEDRELVDHPEQLQLAVFVRPGSAEERRALEQSELIEPEANDEEQDAEWAFASWGAMCTRLPRDADLARQMEMLEQVMTEAEAVLEDGNLDRFHERVAPLWHEADL